MAGTRQKRSEETKDGNPTEENEKETAPQPPVVTPQKKQWTILVMKNGEEKEFLPNEDWESYRKVYNKNVTETLHFKTEDAFNEHKNSDKKPAVSCN